MAEIVIEGLGVRFELDRQQRPMTPAQRHIRFHTTSVWALRDVSCHIDPGAGVALIGGNGAGKTTLLRVMAGVLVADEGRVRLEGRVGSLLSVNAGLMPRLTGRENAMLLGVLLGSRRREARASLEQIRERSQLGPSFDRPVSTYSQGMRARLGFSVIEQSRPDILLLDEIHEAIDGAYRRHVEEIAAALRRRGGIVVAAGHDHQELARLCDRALHVGRAGVTPMRDWPADQPSEPARDLARLAGDR